MKHRYAMLVSVGVLAAAHSVRADTVSDVLGCRGDPCIVSFSAGGDIRSFKAAAREIKRSGRRVIIDGPCLSACAVFADEARGRVCITSRARFGFHKGYLVGFPIAGGPPRLVKRFNPSHSRDIAGWVRKNGGYPSRGFKVMDMRTAKQIWRPC